jgi:hypothetical protein
VAVTTSCCEVAKTREVERIRKGGDMEAHETEDMGPRGIVSDFIEEYLPEFGNVLLAFGLTEEEFEDVMESFKPIASNIAMDLYVKHTDPRTALATVALFGAWLVAVKGYKLDLSKVAPPPTVH